MEPKIIFFQTPPKTQGPINVSTCHDNAIHSSNNPRKSHACLVPSLMPVICETAESQVSRLPPTHLSIPCTQRVHGRQKAHPRSQTSCSKAPMGKTCQQQFQDLQIIQQSHLKDFLRFWKDLLLNDGRQLFLFFDARSLQFPSKYMQSQSDTCNVPLRVTSTILPTVSDSDTRRPSYCPPRLCPH